MIENVYEPSVDYNDNDWDVFGKWIKGVLYTSTANISFTKADGTERVMKCTLRPDLLPKIEVNENKTVKKPSTTSIAVYDLENNGWRSFTLRRVKRVSYTTDVD